MILVIQLKMKIKHLVITLGVALVAGNLSSCLWFFAANVVTEEVLEERAAARGEYREDRLTLPPPDLDGTPLEGTILDRD